MKFENICLKNNQYQMKVGDMLVEMEYSKNNKKIEEYMLKPVNAVELSDCMERLKETLNRE